MFKIISQNKHVWESESGTAIDDSHSCPCRVGKYEAIINENRWVRIPAQEHARSSMSIQTILKTLIIDSR